MNITTETQERRIGVVKTPAEVVANFAELMSQMTSSSAIAMIEAFAQQHKLRISQKTDATGVTSTIPEYRPVVTETGAARWSFEVNGDGPSRNATVGIFANADGTKIWMIYSVNPTAIASVQTAAPIIRL